MVGAGIDEFFVLGADAPGRSGLFASGHGRGELVAMGDHGFIVIVFLPRAHACPMRNYRFEIVSRAAPHGAVVARF